MDFSTNVKRFGSQFVASNESRNPKELAVESFILYSLRQDSDGHMAFKMRTITAIDDDSKHDTHSATLNLDRVLERVMKMHDIGQVDRVIIISDGSSKEYKSANSFAKKKLLAKKYKVAIFHHFYCTDDGKGLVDSIGNIFHSDYRKSIPDLKLRARNVFEVAEWMNKHKSEFGEDQRKNTRLIGKCRSFFAVSLKDTQEARKSGNPYNPISGVNGEGVSQTNYCYAFLPDDDNYVWVRELSCAGCSACAHPDYRKCFPVSGSPGCLNSDVCGKWRRYPILKNGEKDPRKQVQNGAYDGKYAYVT